MKTKSLRKYLAQWQRLEVTLVNDSEFCEELGIHRNTSLRWRTKGLIPFLRLDGSVFYRMSDVLAFLNRRSDLKK